jgi:hypothetical protein
MSQPDEGVQAVEDAGEGDDKPVDPEGEGDGDGDGDEDQEQDLENNEVENEQEIDNNKTSKTRTRKSIYLYSCPSWGLARRCLATDTIGLLYRKEEVSLGSVLSTLVACFSYIDQLFFPLDTALNSTKAE